MTVGIKLTQEEVLNRFKQAHDDKYDYSRFEYKQARTNSDIICRVHGVFKQTPSKHWQGMGCSKCSYILAGFNRRKSPEKLKADAERRHNNKYSYYLEDFKTLNHDIRVLCATHGIFIQRLSHHMEGRGCIGCSHDMQALLRSHTTEQFIAKARLVHGDRYDYSITEYINNVTRVNIICREHGAWSAAPAKHIRGSGCLACAKSGFDISKESYLYVMTFDNKTKVGITNRCPTHRLKEIICSSKHPFVLSETYQSNGVNILNTETLLLKELRLKYSNDTTKYSGSTECFIDVDREWLTSYINYKIKEN